jgi:flavodoxin
MKTLVVYDSVFGNTEKIAIAVSTGLGSVDDVSTCQVNELKPDQLTGFDLLVVGSPTRGFRSTEAIRTFLNAIPKAGLIGMNVAAFDTRIAVDDVKSPVLKLFVRLFGYTAKPIASGLTARGGSLKGLPAGFFVTASEGPLKAGELERAAAWAKSLN